MGLFKPDLYRSFAIGFVAGAVLLSAVMAGKADNPMAGQIIPSATAAPSQLDQTMVDPAQR